MTPLELLRSYDRRVLALAPSLPRDEEASGRWSGIAFRLGEDVMLAPMLEVAEILDPPMCTRVPGARSWFMGIANVRGSLLPVTDLHGFAHNGRPSHARNAKLLVYNREGVYAGIKVDDVLGLKQFSIHDSVEALPSVHEPLRPFIERTFEQADQLWPVFSLALLTRSRAFLQVGKAPGPASEAAAT